MNTPPYESTGIRPKLVTCVGADSNPSKVLSIDPPSRSKNWGNSHDTTWINRYDEEWAAFIKEHTQKKLCSARGTAEAEACPRVWNLPRR